MTKEEKAQQFLVKLKEFLEANNTVLEGCGCCGSPTFTIGPDISVQTVNFYDGKGSADLVEYNHETEQSETVKLKF